MGLFTKTVNQIGELDEQIMKKASERVNQLIKPLHSLGRMEELAIQLAGISGNVYPSFAKKAIIVMAADHGVYEEGFTGNPQEITAMQTIHFSKGWTGVNVFSQGFGAKVTPVDIGVKVNLPKDTGIIHRKIKNGTDNMTKGPAMSIEEAKKAIEVGMEIAEMEIANGANILGVGEMGIGNTVPSTAILAVLGNYDLNKITGRGAGLGQGGLEHKIAVIQKAIEKNNPNRNDGMDVLAKVGGLEIAGMAGVMLAGASRRIPVVIDGYISTAAALIAAQIEPKVRSFLIASHASGEPGGKYASELLGVKPMIHMDMCLGEGSGAALAFPMIDAACRMMKNMATFEEVGMKL